MKITAAGSGLEVRVKNEDAKPLFSAEDDERERGCDVICDFGSLISGVRDSHVSEVVKRTCVCVWRVIPGRLLLVFQERKDITRRDVRLQARKLIWIENCAKNGSLRCWRQKQYRGTCKLLLGRQGSLGTYSHYLNDCKYLNEPGSEPARSRTTVISDIRTCKQIWGDPGP